MIMTPATEVRKDWSNVCDKIMHDKPQFVKRTRDKMCFFSFETMLDVLDIYQYTFEKIVEEDGSITLSLNEIDIIENGKNEFDARVNMANAILEYAMEYYDNYKIYSNAPNRKKHVPYVLRALLIDDVQRIGESLICLNGES